MFLVVGLILAAVVTARLTANAEEAAEFHARFITESILFDLLPDEVIAGAAGVDPLRRLSEVVRSHLIEFPVLGVRLVDEDGRVLISDVQSEHGTTVGLPPEGREALGGTIGSLTQRDANGEEFVTWIPAGASTVVQIRQDRAGITSSVSGLLSSLLIALLAGLSLLYLALIPVARRIGKTLAARSRELRTNEARFRSLVSNSSDVVTLVDAEGSITYQSPSVERVFGYGDGQLIGTPLVDVLHPADARIAQRFLALGAATKGASETVECRWRHADGSYRHTETTMMSLLHDPAVEAVVLNTRDVSERKRLEGELTEQAFHDSLTGLANRALFRDRVEHALSRRGSDTIAVLLLDLDDFKAVNDTLGHAAGDEVLLAVASRLTENLRPSDTAARLGGDEFAVLLEDVGLERATSTAERILRRLRDPLPIRGRDITPYASLGIASSEEADDVDRLLRNADVAMYSAKGAGKNRIAMFEDSMHQAVIDRVALASDLRAAIDGEQLRVEYQPIFDIQTGVMVSAEALLRWRHPTRGDIPPLTFIGMAEETGLIVPIGRWVLQTALDALAGWQRHSPDSAPTVAVNLSARQLAEPDLVDDIRHALRRASVPPSSLTLEITESVMMKDTETNVGRLEELRALGVGIAVDDFGTGYSSLSYLKRFPVDTLKIDRSFVAGVTAGPESSALVRAIISIGTSMRLSTVAEGIEHGEELRLLRDLGCDRGQGFLYSPALPGPEIAQMIAAGADHVGRRRVRAANDGR